MANNGEKKIRPWGYWRVKENVIKEAQKYQCRSDFSKYENGAYESALRNGWLEESIAHMPPPVLGRKGKWLDKEKVIAEARKYQERSKFIRGSNGAYAAAIRYGWAEEAMAHMPDQKRWTRDSVRAEAKKYSNRSAFHDESSGCWGFAKEQGQEFLDDICAHMEVLWEQKWTFEACKAEAAKYKHRKDFDNACTSAYQRAQANGWLDEICAHMDRKGAPWTVKQNVLDAAKAFKSRSDFAKVEGRAYAQAIANGWLEESCAHMEIADNGYLHCVYIIHNQRLKKAYVGITAQKVDARFAMHRYISNSTRSKEITSEEDTRYEQLTPYIYSAAEVKDGIEKEFMDILQEKGFDILNSNGSVGAIGSSSGKWSKEKLAEVAKRYESRMEFRCGDPGAYQAAHKRGLMDEIGYHFCRERVLWNEKMALEMAKKYKSISDIAQNNKKLYRALHRHKWMPKVKEFLPKFHESPVPVDPQTGRFIKKE